MSLFGKGYGDYWLILVILSIGYFVNAVTGPIAQLLVMVEQEKLLRDITILTGLFAVVAAMVLTAWLGLMGSALATGLVLVIQNLVVLGHVSRLYRGKPAPVFE
jgi:O-antigen/teichoic acid export membrane protein